MPLPNAPALLLAAAVATAGCNYYPNHPDNQHDSRVREAVVPNTFLYNATSPRFNEWLDTPAHIHLIDVPLDRVFESTIFAPLNYRVSNLPANAPPVNVESLGMTRRQLLWTIAHEYGLSMTPYDFGDPHLSYIDVQGRTLEE
jgi:hypothetical protein